ncbi:ATP-grasp fold amidoligase family protein [Promicromonospora sukumoe]|uniref:ATP-grasp fold amidoligase family protein n=1 Tax=Promicromonospora sukumoe TaxID=88382 RepID=UPI00039FD69B|nr:ATP-grasp fold amidoligase family protein [Promicromonospora sukumoe]
MTGQDRGLAERLVDRLPPVRRRDELLAARDEVVAGLRSEVEGLQAETRAGRARARRLRGELAELREQVAAATAANEHQRSVEARPSFRRMLVTERGLSRAAHEHPNRSPRSRVSDKLFSKELADSFGVRVPVKLRAWPDLDSIELGSLPDEFVLKSIGGASSRGVFPLRRVGGEYRLISTGDVITLDEMRAQISAHMERDAARPSYDRIRPPFYAEEFVQDLSDSSEIPVDVKLYTFYGRVGQVLLRRVARHGERSGVGYRYLGADGTDLGDVSTGRTTDPTIPVPDRFPELVATAEKISRATGLAFVRVDLYQTRNGVVFGELTPCPGEPQHYTDDHDLLLGRLWQEAQLRLDADVASGLAIGFDLPGGSGGSGAPAAR